jgi:hypothetical protein
MALHPFFWLRSYCACHVPSNTRTVRAVLLGHVLIEQSEHAYREVILLVSGYFFVIDTSGSVILPVPLNLGMNAFHHGWQVIDSNNDDYCD